MANKCYKHKRKDIFIVASNATHALQLAECKRSEFAGRYGEAGKTLAATGLYDSAHALAQAESQIAKSVSQILKADNITDARGS